MDSQADERLSALLSQPSCVCLVCQESVGPEYFERVKPEYMLECWRSHLICRQCLLDYVRSKINSNEVYSIACPAKALETGCLNEYQEWQVEGLLEDEFKKVREDRVISILQRISYT